jgi:hypothetical protein
LISPVHTSQLQALPAYDASPNHSSLSKPQLEQVLQSLKTSSVPSNQAIEGVSDDIPGVFRVSLRAGDVLFVPEGWWHLVESEQCSYAMNVWFKSPLAEFAADGCASHMASYLLRSSVNALLANPSTLSNTARKRKWERNEIIAQQQRGDLSSQRDEFLSMMEFVTKSKQAAKDAQIRHHTVCQRLVIGTTFDMVEVWLPFAHQAMIIDTYTHTISKRPLLFSLHTLFLVL